MAHDQTFSMAAECVEVCFPAWPTNRSVAVPLAARFWQGIGAGPLEAAAFVTALVAVPGAIAALSVVMLSLILAFVLLAPGALALLAWASWRHDRREPLRLARLGSE
jgi:MFS family permease